MPRKKKIEQPTSVVEQLKGLIARIESGEVPDPASALLYMTSVNDVGMSDFHYHFFNADLRELMFLAAIGRRVIEKDIIG